MRRLLSIIASAMVALAGTDGLAAQSVAEHIRDDGKDAAGDVWRIYTAPFHFDANDFPDLAVFSGAVVGSALLDPAIQNAIYRVCAYTPNGDGRGDVAHCDNPLLEVIRFVGTKKPLASLGDAEDIVRASLGVYVIGLATGSDDLREAALGCAVGVESESIARHLVYALVSRPRPRADSLGGPYDISVPGGSWDEHSLPNGHGANALACASFLNHRFEMGAAEPALWTWAGMIAAGRIVEGNHWTSDTVIGGVMGFLVGKLMAERMLRREAEREARRQPAAISPGLVAAPGPVVTPQRDGGLYLGWNLRF